MKLFNAICQAGWRGVWGRMDTCVCMAEFLLCSPETVSTLLNEYTLIQFFFLKERATKEALNRIFKVKKKRLQSN